MLSIFVGSSGVETSPSAEIPNKHKSTKDEIQDARLSLEHRQLRICFGFRYSDFFSERFLDFARNGKDGTE